MAQLPDNKLDRHDCLDFVLVDLIVFCNFRIVARFKYNKLFDFLFPCR